MRPSRTNTLPTTTIMNAPLNPSLQNAQCSDTQRSRCPARSKRRAAASCCCVSVTSNLLGIPRHPLHEDCSKTFRLLDVGKVPTVFEADDLSAWDKLTQGQRVGELMGVILCSPE